MATFERLLLATFLAFAACKMSTDSLRPKTDAECAASGQKACGYKCVDKTDPTSGCGNPGCSACPNTPANAYPACSADFQCSYACAPGWGDCDGRADTGCEVPLAGNDAQNCGACWRTCNYGCTAGTCNPETFWAWGEPRGILYDSQTTAAGLRVYWVDDGNGGELVSTDELWNVSQQLFGLDQRLGSPALSRVALDDARPSVVWATGATNVLGQSVALYCWDPTAPPPSGPATPVWTEPEQQKDERFFGLTVVGGQPIFTREAIPGPCQIIPPGASQCVPTSGSRVRGLTPGGAPPPLSGKALWYGYPDAGGTLAYVVSGTVDELIYSTGIGSWPTRIAIFPGLPPGAQPEWFWVDENFGDVWRVPPSGGGGASTPELVDLGSGAATEMDIQTDGAGVVWTDRLAGKVRAWRAFDGAIFDVGTGGEPRGVALTPAWIYWTDSQSRTVRRVPR